MKLMQGCINETIGLFLEKQANKYTCPGKFNEKLQNAQVIEEYETATARLCSLALD